MTSRADDYRISAAYCAKAAGLAQNADHKKHFDQLAKQWLTMAKQFEESETNFLLPWGLSWASQALPGGSHAVGTCLETIGKPT